MRNLMKACVLCGVVAVVCAPVEARADGYATPWIGANLASESGDGQTTFGFTLGYMGAGVFGFEGDFGYSPDFFGSSDAFGKVTGVAVMGNAILGVPVGGTHGAGVRPFVTAGLGLMRTHVDAGTVVNFSRSNNEFGYNVGAGMMGFFNDHVGLRGDVRYLRTIEDVDRGSGIDFEPGAFRYWRLSGGVTFR